jgi:hypothetical protein
VIWACENHAFIRIAAKGEYCQLRHLRRLKNHPNPTQSLSGFLIPIISLIFLL